MMKATMVRLPAELRRRAKVKAAETDTSLQELITRALEEYLDKEGKR